MSKEAFIKIKLDEEMNVSVEGRGNRLQQLCLIASFIKSVKDGTILNDDDAETKELLKKIIDSIWDNPDLTVFSLMKMMKSRDELIERMREMEGEKENA